MELFAYADHQVRVVLVDGEPWFVLADLARVLEIVDVSRLASRLDDEVRQTHPISDSLGRTQQTTVVNEPGMYEVVIRSDKPEAVAFRRWITSEVLPAIRRTGSYSTSPAPALEGPSCWPMR
ncbi:BRO family, N-terminal domain protein [Mycobacterium xenopi 3993]|nr:BRO family, N-terminal domain protein [Mycobacterium xenopi 3993]